MLEPEKMEPFQMRAGRLIEGFHCRHPLLRSSVHNVLQGEELRDPIPFSKRPQSRSFLATQGRPTSVLGTAGQCPGEAEAKLSSDL